MTLLLKVAKGQSTERKIEGEDEWREEMDGPKNEKKDEGMTIGQE